MDDTRPNPTKQVGAADAPPRPTPPPVNFDAIPASLRAMPRWSLWRYELRKDESSGVLHWTKIPYRPNGYRAKTSDLSTWAKFDAARLFFTISKKHPKPYDGIGYLIAPDAGQIGVDLDSAIDPATGQPWPWAKSIIDGLAPSYGELSPSGKGAKFVVLGEALPTQKTGGNFRPLPVAWKANEGAAIELYHRKFFTLTGNIFDGCEAELHDRGDYAHSLFRQLMLDREARRPKKHAMNGHTGADATTSANDLAILAKARGFKNGEEFGRLWAGDISGYASHSQADLALANMLAFVVGPDENRIDQLFRQSGLMRDKWERDDYRSETIGMALASRTEFYQWRKSRRMKRAQAVAKSPANVDGAELTGDAELPQIRNWQLVENDAQNDEGGESDEKPKYAPLTMRQVLSAIAETTGDWPRRVGKWLFVHERSNEIDWLEKTAATFGYLASKTGIIPWRKGIGYVSQEQVAAELARTATNYVAIERFPHWPAMAGHYYACEAVTPGDGSTLNALLDRFCPSTQIDRDLFLAMFATPGWGGPGGSRPAFLITAKAGRGAGKTKNASMVGHLWDGLLDFHQQEDLAVIKQRLLSPDGLAARVAMLDNIKSLRFSWAELESLITIPTISGKRMYVGEGSRPNTLTWLLTLNGASLSTDMAQRVVTIEIDRPERTETWEQDTINFITSNRPALLADIAAFFAEETHPPRKLSRWASWERDVLGRLPEPEEAQAVILERQQGVDVEQEEADILQEYFAKQLSDLYHDFDDRFIHLPSALAAAWYNAAVNEKHKLPGAARILKQLCEEKRICWLKVNPSRSEGRGFVWIGANANAAKETDYDVETRIETHLFGCKRK